MEGLDNEFASLPVVTKPEGALKSTRSLATANNISMDVAVEVVLSAIAGIFTFKEEKRTALKAFLCGQHVFALLQTG